VVRAPEAGLGEPKSQDKGAALLFLGIKMKRWPLDATFRGKQRAKANMNIGKGRPRKKAWRRFKKKEEC
jgi:hypothetical protein